MQCSYSPQNNAENMLLVGKINAIFGVKGWIKILSHTEPIVNICKYLPLYIKQKDSFTKLNITNCKSHGKTIIAQIDNINDCDKARELVGLALYINKLQLPKINDNEYYCYDLINMAVINKNNEKFGLVSHLIDTNANAVLVVKNDKNEYLVPFIEPYIISVDLDDKIITIDWGKDY